MKKETIKITVTSQVNTKHELELPCYRMSLCNDKPFYIYKISGTNKDTIVEAVGLSGTPTYEIDCLANAFRDGNTEATANEWLGAITSVLDHLNAIKVEVLDELYIIN